MANNFRAIGFDIQSANDLAALAKVMAPNGTALTVPNGKLVHLGPDQGVELWIQVDANGQPIGCQPHFFGPSRILVDALDIIPDPNGWDGMIRGMTVEIGQGDVNYLIVCNLPQQLMFRDLIKQAEKVRFKFKLQVSAFAHEVHGFPTVDDFNSQHLEVLG